jgi:Protein of unknown function (DUF1569)
VAYQNSLIETTIVMKNIFNEADYVAVVQRINNLTANSNGQWGKMNLTQMLEHCTLQLKRALSIAPAAKAEGPALYRTVIGRRMALYVVPWPKGSATPSDMNMEINGVDVMDFEKERNQLLALLQQVRQNDNFGAHLFFGPLNKKDWGRLIWKHLDHHLRQFNA